MREEIEANLVSVIVPVYNRPDYLEETLSSIRAQQFEPLETVIIDDGSTDDTAALAKRVDPTIRYHYQEHRGVAVARNHGLDKARGEIIGFLDSDDIWPQDKLITQVALLRAHPEAEIIQGKIQLIELNRDDSGDVSFEKRGEPFYHTTMGSMVFRKSVFDRVGGFNDEYLHGEDLDWFTRAKEHGVVIHRSEEIGVIYRIHDTNMTRNLGASLGFILRICRETLARRRAAEEAESK